jgi:hypothetical protein
VTSQQDFEQLSRDLIDAIYLRMDGRYHRLDDRFKFLAYLPTHEVREFSDEIPALNSRIKKSPAAEPDKVYEMAFIALSDKLAVYRIVAAVALMKRAAREDRYR